MGPAEPAQPTRGPSKKEGMTTASDRPPTPKRSDTQSPFAVLSPTSGGKQTGPQIRINEQDSGEHPAAIPLHPSIPPESLKKPFASLTPKKPVPSGAASVPGGAPPPPPSQLFKETASLRPATTAQPAARPTVSRRPDSGAVAKYGTCTTHGTALTSQGTCVLCTREAERRRAKRTQRLILLLSLLAIGVGLAAAYLVMPK